MRTSAKVLIFSYLVAITASQLHGAQNAFPDPIISANSGGLEFRLKDNDYKLVSFHFSVNKPLAGVAAGDHAIDINTKTGTDWVDAESSIHLSPGDTVNYWVMALKTNGEGLQITDRTFTYVKDTATTTTAVPTMPKSSTPPPAVLTTVISGVHSQTNAMDTPRPDHGGSGANSGTGTGSGSGSFPTGSGSHTASGSFLSGGGTASSSFGSDNHLSGGSASHFGSATGGGSCSCPYGPGIGDGFIDDRTCTTFPCLVFEDNFDFLNHKVWEHELTASGGGNWEFQYYTNNRTNSYTKNGVLYLKPTLTADHYGAVFMEHGALDSWGGSAADVCTSNMDWGCKREGRPGQIVNPIQSARLRSSRGFNFRYGKVEVDAKLPGGDWLWPAIWMLPRQNVYGKWPASGEIDIMESRGNAQYTSPTGETLGSDNIGSTLHFGPNFWTNQWPKAHQDVPLSGGSYADAFHKYGVEWDNTSITFSVDGQETLKVVPPNGGFWKFGDFDQLQGFDNPWREGTHMAPFDQEFYLLLNVAVGGTGFFADDNVNGGAAKPWQDGAGHEADRFWAARDQWYPTWHPDVNNGEDAAMQINYIKVWKTRPDPPRH